MNKNKIILEHCPNFHKIVNFEFYEGDLVTEKLLHIYENYIFSIDVNNKEDLERVFEIDRVLAKYIDDCIFRKEMKYGLTQIKVKKNETNVLEAIVLNIIKLCDNYEEAGQTTQIYISRWI